MDWLNALIWPTAYLLLAGAVILFVWAMLLRNKNKKNTAWKEVLTVAVFCLLSSGVMLLVHFAGFQLSFTTRLGLVSVILVLYAYYSYRRQQK
ncbi:Hypothetical protein LUCI_3109 [Lucifera butyrica]|uniref:Uncharacterized protein n=1 Tax=Lucifera butyrica TaxID=1351585 RepID=A0A498R8K5_9FIRM|nr:hypothetical protein [Lucifera butyrica]VBB07844.1 Hypothetical protein LUCI_3109 [Lucifera butyrica]